MKPTLLIMLVLLGHLLSAQTFTDVYQGLPFRGIAKGAVAFADVDGDTDLDVFLTGFELVILYLNDGEGNYREVMGTPFEGVSSSSIAIADVDGDTDLDVLIMGENVSFGPIVKLYLNDGSGIFSEDMDNSFDALEEGSVTFADVDGDTDQDILITGGSDSLATQFTKLYTNDGLGTFNEVAGTPFEGVFQSSIAFADVDGDTDLDVLITGVGSLSFGAGIAKLYLNDGSGMYTEVMGTPFEGVSKSSIAFADVDGDTDQDVLITGDDDSFTSITKLYTNDGTGNFTEVMEMPFDSVSDGSVAFADIDGDADQDLLITGEADSSGNQVLVAKLYTNDGTGMFSEVMGTTFEAVFFSSVAFGDVNGDTNLDLLITGGSEMGLISKLYTNDGAGTYTEVPGPTFEGVGDGSIAFADVDGDTDKDLFVTGRNNAGVEIARLYENDGTGEYSEVAGTSFRGVRESAIAFADVDGDTDQDLLITGEDSSETLIAKLYINDGSGTFSEVMGTPFEGVHDGFIDFVDVDGDTDQDVLITGYNDSNMRIAKLYTNDGSGTFNEVAGTPFEGVRYSSVAFADIDGDTDQDLLLSGENASDEPVTNLYTNDGMGTFNQVMVTSFDSVSYSSIAFSDVDGDTDQDVLITGFYFDGSFNMIAKLYTNDGTGTFTEAVGTPFVGVGGGSIAFVDVDGDTDQDVLVTGLDSSLRANTKLYINDGNGTFSEVGDIVLKDISASSIAFADVDGDSDPDVVIAGEHMPGYNISRLYTNELVTTSISGDIRQQLVDFAVYPNPAETSTINISFTSEENGWVDIRILGIDGRLLGLHQEQVTIGEQTFPIDISSLHRGMYIIQLGEGLRAGAKALLIK